jgi:hypothetical protein
VPSCPDNNWSGGGGAGNLLTFNDSSVPPVTTYSLKFRESGLPSGVTWQATLNGVSMSILTDGGTDSIAWTGLANGTYTYSVAAVSYWYQTTIPYNGRVVVNGTSVTERTLHYVQLLGISDDVTVTDFNVTSSSVACKPLAELFTQGCFSIQQNFFVDQPAFDGTDLYWIQNLVLIGRNALGDVYAASEYSVWNDTSSLQLLACRDMILGSCHLTIGMFEQVALPATFDLKSVLSAGAIALHNFDRTYSFAGTGPGASIVSSSSSPLAYEPELVVVGEISDGLATFATNELTNGSVAVSLELGSVWVVPTSQVVLTSTSDTSTGESSANLEWATTSPSTSAFSNDSDSTDDQGVSALA